MGLSDEENETFIETLDMKISHKNNIIMGDLNAQVGRTNYEEVIGPFGWGQINMEGENLLDLCVRNRLIIGNSWFMKRESHKVTRYGWDGISKSVIDYFITNKDMLEILNDVKVIPSENLSSDHRLLVATFEFENLKEIRLTQDRKIRVWKLKDIESRLKYQDILGQHLPTEPAATVEDEWKKFKDNIVEAAEKICGRTSNKRRWKETPWWNNTVKMAILHKNNSFRNYFNNSTNENKIIYQEAKREANKIVERERKKWMDEWTNILQDDYRSNKKLLYGMMKNKRTV